MWIPFQQIITRFVHGHGRFLVSSQYWGCAACLIQPSLFSMWHQNYYPKAMEMRHSAIASKGPKEEVNTSASPRVGLFWFSTNTYIQFSCMNSAMLEFSTVHLYVVCWTVSMAEADQRFEAGLYAAALHLLHIFQDICYNWVHVLRQFTEMFWCMRKRCVPGPSVVCKGSGDEARSIYRGIALGGIGFDCSTGLSTFWRVRY